MVRSAIAWGIILLPIPACSQSSGVDAPEDVAASLRSFCKLYNTFVAERDIDSTSAAEVKRWAEQLGKEKLDKLGVRDVAQAFSSPRDHQPYELFPVKKGMTRSLLAFEKTGVDGQHFGIDITGRVREYNDDTINSILKKTVPTAPPKR
jgi:hypothetical protein